MANHKDAIKRNKQNATRAARNKHYRTKMRNQIKKLRAVIAEGDKDAASALLPATVGVIQRVAAKGVIHRNQAARRVSRLNAAVKALVAG